MKIYKSKTSKKPAPPAARPSQPADRTDAKPVDRSDAKPAPEKPTAPGNSAKPARFRLPRDARAFMRVVAREHDLAKLFGEMVENEDHRVRERVMGRALDSLYGKVGPAAAPETNEGFTARIVWDIPAPAREIPDDE
jgi:hypothetical protein